MIVDYLQLMRAERPAETRVQDIGSFSRGLKAIARELNCPVVALSQLNRNVEHRPDKRPTMADLERVRRHRKRRRPRLLSVPRGLLRPRPARAGEADLLIRKHRNGPTGLDVRLVFDRQHVRFRNAA